ncbi:MAG: hypothetical protein K2H15_05590 [Muribaculaceae bacterium]|nr:hypothetical protein [Muribaculaceae bacterium]
MGATAVCQKRPSDKGRADNCRNIALAMLGTAFFSFSIPVVLFYFSIPVGILTFPLAVIGGISVPLFIGQGLNLRQTGWIAVVPVLIFLSLLVAGFVYDVSYDGMRYHQETVVAVCNGWNPLDSSTESVAPRSMWSRHYVKAVEICAAVISSFTGRLETGKGIGLILALGAGAGVYGALRENVGRCLERERLGCVGTDGWSRLKSFWFTLCIVGNPVVGSQLFTYYIDFYKYLYLLYVLLGIYYTTSQDNRERLQGMVMLFFTLVLAMSTKFNFFFEAGLWMVLAFIWTAIKGKFEELKRLFWVSVVALAVGTLLCYDPYITNWINEGHPLYPLMGAGAIDIMTYNTPEQYIGSNRFVNFFSSLLAVAQPYIDQRSGGFTIFMPAILLLSLYIGWRLRRRLSGVVWYIAICTLVSCFIFEQSWWARYICQLWLIGAVFLVASQMRDRIAGKAGYVMSVFMFLAGGWALARGVYISVFDGYYIKSLMETAKTERVEVVGFCEPQMKKHLDEYGVDYVFADSIPAGSREKAFYYFYNTHPFLILSDAQKEALEERMAEIGKTTEKLTYSHETEEIIRPYEEDFQ